MNNASIERIDGLPFGRAYKVSIDDQVNYLPSVTTILKLNEDPFLEELRAELGEEKYELIRNRGSDRGTVMHRWLEVFLDHYKEHRDPSAALLFTQEYMRSTDEFDGKLLTDKARAMDVGRSLFYNFYNHKFYKRIGNILHNEIFMYTFFRNGWAGAADFIYEDSRGKLVVEDFKSASIIKDVSHIDNYRMQISCYMFKYAEMYGRLPDYGRIVISNEKATDLQEVIVDRNDMKHYLKQFISLRQQFEILPEWSEFKKSVLC